MSVCLSVCLSGARIPNMRASLPIHTQPPRSDFACPPPSSSAPRTAAPLMSERPSSRTPWVPSATVGRRRHSLRTRPEGISRCRLRSRLAPLPSNSSLARHTRPPAPWQVATAALCTLQATATEACLNARRVTQTTQLVQVYREGPHDCSAPLQPLTPCYDPAPSVSICQR